jgi:hypothetical protein
VVYFIRYTGNPRSDLERGYSFVGYSLVATKESALIQLAESTSEMDEDFEISQYSEDNDYRVGQDNETGLWGSVRSGLCGFGAFDSVEEAIENIEDNQYHATTFCVIFEGLQTYDQELDGLDDGITFHPVRIAKILTYNPEKQDYE